MRNLLIISIEALLLSACTMPATFCPNPSYTEALYEYLKDSPDFAEQENLMNDYFSECSDQGMKISPGAYAHMGLLYSKSGDYTKAEEYFNKEKALFPESAQYLDFLMKKKKDTNTEKASSTTEEVNIGGKEVTSENLKNDETSEDTNNPKEVNK